MKVDSEGWPKQRHDRVNSSPVRESLYTLIELMGGRKSCLLIKIASIFQEKVLR